MKDINFLVEEKPFEDGLKKEDKSTAAVKILALILVFAVGVAILFVPSTYVRILERRAITIENKLADEKYKEVKAVKAQLSQTISKVSNKKVIINAIDSEYIPASQMLLIVENALPSGCYLKSLNFNGKSVIINGIAENSLIVNDFLGNLSRLKLFTINTHNISIDESQKSVEFSMTFNAQNQGGE